MTPAAIDDRIFCTQLRLFADVAELADALDSGSSDSNILWVQVPSSAPKSRHRHKAVPAFLYDEDLNPPKQGSPKKRSFFGEEEQQRSLRKKSRKAGFSAQLAATKVPSSAPKSRHRHKAVPVFLYDEGLNPPKQGSPKKRSFFGEEEQQRSLRRKSRKAGFFAMRSLLRRKSHHPHQKADTATRRCLLFYMMRAVLFLAAAPKIFAGCILRRFYKNKNTCESTFRRYFY